MTSWSFTIFQNTSKLFLCLLTGVEITAIRKLGRSDCDCFFYTGFFGAVFASKGYHFKNIFDFTTAGDWDFVATVERLHALHYSVDFIFVSLGIMSFVVEL